MDPYPSRGPAAAGPRIIVADPGWRRMVRNPERIAARAAAAARGATAGGGAVTVVLASDAAVKRLNARHRGRNKPTNVLTYRARRARHARRDHPGAGRGATRGAPPPPADRRTIWRIWSCTARCTWPGYDHHHPARRGAWSMARRASCTGCACPTRGNAHERRTSRHGLLERLRGLALAAPDRAVPARIDRRAGAGGRRRARRCRASRRNSTGTSGC